MVGYVAETPVWRPSYRLVISGDAKRSRRQAARRRSPGLGHRAEPLRRGLEGREALARRGRAARVPGDAGKPVDPAAPDRHRSGRGDRAVPEERDEPAPGAARTPPPRRRCRSPRRARRGRVTLDGIAEADERRGRSRRAAEEGQGREGRQAGRSATGRAHARRTVAPRADEREPSPRAEAPR